MTVEESKEKDEQLRQIILKLASTNPFPKDESFVNDQIEELSSLYQNDYRHHYSEFLQILTDIDNTPEYDLDSLQDSLDKVNQKLLESDNKETYESFDKLCDHLKLEIARLQTNKGNLKKFEQLDFNFNELSKTANKITTIQNQLGEITKDINNEQEKLEKITEEMNKVKINEITVLSIFSAIVITFFGGLNYISSALCSVNEAPIINSLLICGIVGLVLFNVFFYLFKFLSDLIGINKVSWLSKKHFFKSNLALVLVIIVLILISKCSTPLKMPSDYSSNINNTTLSQDSQLTTAELEIEEDNTTLSITDF